MGIPNNRFFRLYCHRFFFHNAGTACADAEIRLDRFSVAAVEVSVALLRQLPCPEVEDSMNRVQPCSRATCLMCSMASRAGMPSDELMNFHLLNLVSQSP